ncbi:MAG: protein-methionine-sulfoxide reductase catalytic subunit MsrP [Alphaproteobacteria bacterium]|nr:protein-methionine-sulfoxide reductase catalytic subunit MsrP [Alphaproteobacteria bacterium]
MLLRRKKAWELKESEATPESVFRQRRALVKAIAAGPILAAGAGLGIGMGPKALLAAVGEGRYPAPRNEAFTLDRPVSPEDIVTTYNNFFEFGSHKQISKAAQRLEIDPWNMLIDGMVEKEMELGFEDLLKQVELEERLYRHRCVEAWAMAVPWTGFPMRRLVEIAKPLSGAKYIRMETFLDDRIAPGQRQRWYPWPYVEGLTMAEATNDLAFIGTGVYGKPMPKQMGAPIRLVVPWKYGFKSIKSIVRLTFTDERPVSFWEELQAKEYGFWANVNPEVDHPRWSQATERMLGSNERVPTLKYNGYEEQVAHLYKDLDVGDRLYR